MAISFILTLLLLGGGIALVVYSVVQGSSKFGLFIIFPWIQANDPLGMLGVLLLVAGFIALMISISLARFRFALKDMDVILGGDLELEEISQPEKKKKKKTTKPKSSFGAIIMLGPIPIVIGSDKKVSKNMMYIGLIIAVILIAVTLLWFLAAFYSS
jgi:uncharacterized protein (TIGR00304 family)